MLVVYIYEVLNGYIHVYRRFGYCVCENTSISFYKFRVCLLPVLRLNEYFSATIEAYKSRTISN